MQLIPFAIAYDCAQKHLQEFVFALCAVAVVTWHLCVKNNTWWSRPSEFHLYYFLFMHRPCDLHTTCFHENVCYLAPSNGQVVFKTKSLVQFVSVAMHALLHTLIRSRCAQFRCSYKWFPQAISTVILSASSSCRGIWLSAFHTHKHKSTPANLRFQLELFNQGRGDSHIVFRGVRRNVSNIRGAESHEAPPWLAPSEKNF